jgi:16S rRNA (uracil1498-N3)-methyltransferase
MRFFYVGPSDIQDSQALLKGAEADHATNVVRLKPGATVGLVDGLGFEYSAVIERITPGRVELAVTDRWIAAGRSPVDLCVAQGFLKEKKMDRLVRQLSELGVALWVPFLCERAVARPESKRSVIRSERWRKIALEALKQSRRGTVMKIADAARFGQLLEEGRCYDVRILFWEKAREAITAEHLRGRNGPVASVMIVLGPEGGFTETEAIAAEAAGFVVAGLGPRILRAETAAVAACALVQYLCGDLGGRQKNLDKK